MAGHSSDTLDSEEDLAHSLPTSLLQAAKDVGGLYAETSMMTYECALHALAQLLHQSFSVTTAINSYFQHQLDGY